MPSAPSNRPDFAREGYRSSKYRRSVRRLRLWKFAGFLLAGILIVAAGSSLFLRRPHIERGRSTYVAPTGERIRATLDDGSTVLLAPGSTLRVATGFGSHGRHVFLDGEGDFDVARDTANSFTVHTGSVTTRVLGTHFDIRAFSSERTIQVAVLDGTVAFDDTVIMQTGAIARRNAAGIVTRVTDIDPTTLIAWTRGILTFDHVPLSEVLPQLKRWYGLNIYLTNNRVSQQTVTATFRDTTSPSDVLHTLLQTLDVRVQRHGSDILIQTPL